jgi:hypothetical protein
VRGCTPDDVRWSKDISFDFFLGIHDFIFWSLVAAAGYGPARTEQAEQQLLGYNTSVDQLTLPQVT